MNFLSQENKILTTLWETSDNGLALVDRDGNFLRANPKFCIMLEYTENELLEKNFREITHPEDVYQDDLASRQVKNGEKNSYVITKRYLPKMGGCVIWAKLHVEAIKDDKGDFMFFLSQIGNFAVQDNDKQLTIIKEPPKELTVKQAIVFIKENWKFIITIVTLLGTISYKAITLDNRLRNLENTPIIKED